MLLADLELAHGQGARLVVVQLAQIAQAEVAQRAPPGGRRCRLVRAAGGVRFVGLQQRATQLFGDKTAQAIARFVQGARVDQGHLFGKRRFAGQGQGFGGESGIGIGVFEKPCGGFDEGLRPVGRAADRDVFGGCQDQAAGQALPGFPAIEGVAVVGQQVRQLFVAPGEVENHRRREVAQQRNDGGGGQLGEDELLLEVGQREDARRPAAVGGAVFTGDHQRHVFAVCAVEADGHRDVEGTV
jgi:hypothetical protein